MVHSWSVRRLLDVRVVATIDRRSTKTGRVRWRARIRRRGVAETASFGSRAEAEQWARTVEHAIERGEWTRADDSGQLPFSQLLGRFLAARRPSLDTRRQLEWWRANLGSEPISKLSRPRLLQLRDRLAHEPMRRGRSRSPATVNRYMAALSALFTWALEAGYLDHHLLRGVQPLTESPARLRSLSEDEKDRLLSACREAGGLRLRALVVLALASGARRGELLRLRWSDLDLANRRVTFQQSGRLGARSLPLPARALKLLRELSRVRCIDNDEIFADASGRAVFPRAAWRSVLDLADIEDFRFHDLRHSAAAYLAMSGASLPEIAEILGHRSLQAVRRYSHLTGPQTSVAIREMHDNLFNT